MKAILMLTDTQHTLPRALLLLLALLSTSMATSAQDGETEASEQLPLSTENVVD